MPDLRIREVSKTYSNGVRALQRVNLTVPPDAYGVLDPKGARKSSLMRTIATLQEPDEGEIHLGPLDVLRQKELAALEREHLVISTNFLAGRTMLHVFCDRSPSQGFDAVAPDLEDVDSSAMSGRVEVTPPS